MTPVRSAQKILPVLLAVAVIAFASYAIAQLQAPDPKDPGSATPATTSGTKSVAAPEENSPPASQRTGAPQAAAPVPPSEPATGQKQADEPAAAQSAEAPAPANMSAPDSPETTTEETVAQKSEAVPEKPATPDMSVFIEALRAAERTNANLAAQIAKIEASAAQQREQDQAFIREMIRGVLLLSGGMAVLGLISLVAIVYLQIRSSKQQAITFAAQLQALTSQIALPGPGATGAAALRTSKTRFDSTAKNIEEKLSDLESMAAGLPRPHDEVYESEVPQGAANAERSSEFSVHASAARSEKATELLAKADSLLMQQQPEVALAYLDQAIGRNPSNSEAHLKRGSALERLNRLDDALASYDRAIEAEPTMAVAFLAKAGVLNKLQRYGEALKCYEVALAQQGDPPESESPAA